MSSADVPSGITRVSIHRAGDPYSRAHTAVAQVRHATLAFPAVSGVTAVDTGNGRAVSLSGDPDSDVSFGCVWSAQRPLGNVDCRWRWEHVGKRGPGRVFGGDVIFED